MRKALIASLVLAGALLVAAAANGKPGRRERRGRHPRLLQGQPQPDQVRHAHDRRRQPGLPAVVRGPREEAVEGERPDERQGLRVGGRLRGREAARVREERGRVDVRAVQQLVQAGQEDVRLLRHAGLVHARSARRRSTSRTAYYFVNQSVVGRKGTPIASVRSIDGLKKYKLGAQLGTTSYDYIVNTIKPTRSRSSTTRTTRPCRR